DSSVALYDRNPPTAPPIGQLPVHLDGRTTTILTFTATVTSAGTKTFVAVADPNGTLVETDKTNNQAAVTVTDAGNTIDLALFPGDVTLSATTLTVGDRLVVTAVVRNLGTEPVSSVPVILAHPEASGLATLAETRLSLDPGASQTVTLAWKTAI